MTWAKFYGRLNNRSIGLNTYTPDWAHNTRLGNLRSPKITVWNPRFVRGVDGIWREAGHLTPVRDQEEMDEDQQKV